MVARTFQELELDKYRLENVQILNQDNDEYCRKCWRCTTKSPTLQSLAQALRSFSSGANKYRLWSVSRHPLRGTCASRCYRILTIDARRRIAGSSVLSLKTSFSRLRTPFTSQETTRIASWGRNRVFVSLVIGRVQAQSN